MGVLDRGLEEVVGSIANVRAMVLGSLAAS